MPGNLVRTKIGVRNEINFIFINKIMGIKSFYRGDTKVIGLSFLDKKAGLPIDITGSELWLTFRINVEDANFVLQKKITTFLDPVNGKAQIVLLPAETALLLGGYYYDIKLVDSSGNVTTILNGTITVKYDITRNAV